MFDALEETALTKLAEVVDAMREAVRLRDGRTPSPANTPDSARLDVVEGYERMVRTLQGLLAGHVAELYDSVLAQEQVVWAGRAGVLAIEEAAYRLTGHEVAAARNVSPPTGQIQTRTSTALRDRHPFTWRLVVDGAVSYGAATRVVHACLGLDDATCRELDRKLAEDALELTPGRLEKAARRRVAQADPEAARKKARQARADKSIDLVNQPDSMATLEGYLPAEEAMACFQSLERSARRLKASGDTRRLKDLMCDLFYERLTGRSKATPVPTEVGVVVTLPALTGCDPEDGGEEPAHLVGYGTIPPDIARDLAASGDTFLRRLVVDPATGTVTGVSERRSFDGKKRAHILYRDQTCRWPGCERPIAHVDHVEDWSISQDTSVPNGQGLCEAHNLFKTHPRITATASADGSVTVQMPSGRRYTSRPPPAPGRG